MASSVKSWPRGQSGFTLLEVITVISIVMLLASILEPAVVQAKRLAVRTACQGNLRQIGLAFELYEGDYDDFYPAAIDRYTRDHPDFLIPPHPAISTIPDLVSVVSPYAGKGGVWRCPADLEPVEGTQDEASTGIWYPSTFAYAGTSYAFWPCTYFGLSDTSLNDSALRIARDTSGLWHGVRPDEPTAARNQNYLFGDGHVRFIVFLDQ